MKKAWNKKKSNQAKIIVIFLVSTGVLLLFLGFAQIRQAIKIKNSRGYSWNEIIELTKIDDITKKYSWGIYYIEVSARKALTSFILSLFAFTSGFMLHEIRKAHIFYLEEIEAIKSKIGT